MRIVTDGEYFAIEKGWLFKKYQSLICKDNWWSVGDTCYSHCWGNRQEIDRNWRILNRRRDIRPVKDVKVVK